MFAEQSDDVSPDRGGIDRKRWTAGINDVRGPRKLDWGFHVDRLKEITSTEKLLQVIRSRKAEPPTTEAGPAEALPPITAMAPVPQADGVPPPESPVAAAQIVPAPQLTDNGFPTDREKSSTTLVIRDVRPNQPEKAAFAETSPVPVEAFPIDAETFPSPATADVQAIMDVGTVAAVDEPGSPRPSVGESARVAADAAGAVPEALESSRTEPEAPIEPLIADEHGDMELDQEERAAAARLPQPKGEFFKKALSGLAALKKRGATKADGGPGSPPEEAPANAVAAFPLKAGRFRIALPRLASLKKTSTVGIDIGHDYLRLVRTVKTSGGKWEILDRRRFALPPKTPRETPEFSSFLKASLASVCGSAKRTDLWVNMSAANVDVRHVRIPKVPKKQIANAVYWTVKKETPFDEKELVLDFETQGEVIEQGIPKLAVMVYTAPRREVEELKEIFVRIGRPLTGISIVPFAMQNLLRTAWITAHDGNIASLFIGNDFSRIDIYSSDNLVMTRGIKAGMSSMVEALVDRFNERPGRRGDALTIDQGRKVIRCLSPDSPPPGGGQRRIRNPEGGDFRDDPARPGASDAPGGENFRALHHNHPGRADHPGLRIRRHERLPAHRRLRGLPTGHPEHCSGPPERAGIGRLPGRGRHPLPLRADRLRAGPGACPFGQPPYTEPDLHLPRPRP
jgi:hypothetical protein